MFQRISSTIVRILEFYYWILIGLPLTILYRIFIWPFVFVFETISNSLHRLRKLIFGPSKKRQWQPPPVDKDSQKTANISVYDHVEGYVVVVKEYDPSSVNLPLFNSRDIPKLLEPPKKKDKRKHLRDNLHYATVDGVGAKLTLCSHMSKKKEVLDLSLYVVDIVPAELPAGRYFSRSFPILLKQKSSDKAIYIFCPSSVVKERWYISIKKASNVFRTLPIVQPLLEGLSPLNALLMRIWHSVAATDRLFETIKSRVIKKIDKVKKPAFVGDIRLKSLKLGRAPPQFENMVVESTSQNLLISGLVSYRGGFEIVIETEAKLDSSMGGVKFSLILSIVVEEISGKIVFQMNQLPSSRVWWAFKEPPKMVLRITPLVGDRNIGFNMVRDAIEKKIQEALQDSIVLPNMEDISLYGDYGKDVWIGHIIGTNKNLKGSDRLLPDGPASSNISRATTPVTPANGHADPDADDDLDDDSSRTSQVVDAALILENAAARAPSLNLSPSMKRKNSFSPRLNSNIVKFNAQDGYFVAPPVNVSSTPPTPATPARSGTPSKWFTRSSSSHS